ncbi:MAG TPA: PepSY-associated TM helix domain-containing protein [Sphingopyxis sp.]|jgi:uncharacterized iron-regulated membrane protein|uniref:PepSY-associated TM helix domain-containing protein n=1 Tax=Sphingopyxis sp. TaxID=1908224 RepID=UPI002E11E645|nr:PepSY-associated TM helix domain-containing protein [Sphingopyxis sp.]
MKARRFLVIWHRWFGLLAAVWLLILAITGSVIVWSDEIDGWLNPDLRHVAATGDRLPVQVLVDRLEAANPGYHVDYLMRPREATDSVLAFVAPNGPAPADYVFRQTYLDPYSGQILGQRIFGEAGLDRRRVMQFLYQLHMDLSLGPWGYWFFGLVALLWMIDHFVSIMLSFPKAKNWQRSFTARWRAGGFRLTFDLHRAGGLWLLPVTFTLALTGWALTWNGEFRTVVGQFSPISAFPIEDVPPKPQPIFRPALDVDRAIAIAESRPGAGAVNAISWHPDKHIWWLRSFDPRDLDDLGRRWTVVDYTTGQVLAERHQAEGSSGDLFNAWMFPLHSGEAFGLAGRIIISLSGVVLSIIIVTGLMIWARKRKANRRKNLWSDGSGPTADPTQGRHSPSIATRVPLVPSDT